MQHTFFDVLCVVLHEFLALHDLKKKTATLSPPRRVHHRGIFVEMADPAPLRSTDQARSSLFQADQQTYKSNEFDSAFDIWITTAPYNNIGPFTPFLLFGDGALGGSIGVAPCRETILPLWTSALSGLDRSDGILSNLWMGSSATIALEDVASSAMACNRTTTRNSIRRRLICSRP